MEGTLTRSALAEASIAAAQQWLSREYAKYSGKPLPIFIAKNVTEFRQLNRIKVKDGDEEKDVPPPFLLYSIGSIGPDPERAGLKARRATNGVTTAIDKFKGVATMMDARPAILGLGVAFISQGIDDVFLFAETLINAAPNVTLILTSDTGYKTHCTLLIDPDLTVPAPEDGPGDLYRFETAMRLRTYVGATREQRIIRKVKVEVFDSTNTEFDPTRQNNPVLPEPVFNGEAESLLKTAFNYYDLFDKNSPHYRYDYQKEVEGKQ